MDDDIPHTQAEQSTELKTEIITKEKNEFIYFL